MRYCTRQEAIDGIEAAMGVTLVSPETIHDLDLREIWRALEGALLMEPIERGRDGADH